MLGWMDGAAFAHLTIAGDGTASGHFLPDDVYFMPARPHAAPELDRITLGGGEMSRTDLDPKLLEDPAARFAAQLGAPTARLAWTGEAGEIATLDDPVSGAHADLQPPADGGWTIHQRGPLRLWDDAARALSTLLSAGRPHQSEYGLTVTPEGSGHGWVTLAGRAGTCLPSQTQPVESAPASRRCRWCAPARPRCAPAP
ncbi:hypothetical protein [Nonomuraea sp. WAC 01424]|uniref:hypothetical protein n=1 Tax=Nonomuraea sp. WAC 01424 TaxID=2203200 RepID=UPI000F77900C|nr:hypothetical protein [Nonomuraea sp. WAC 01424]